MWAIAIANVVIIWVCVCGEYHTVVAGFVVIVVNKATIDIIVIPEHHTIRWGTVIWYRVIVNFVININWAIIYLRRYAICVGWIITIGNYAITGICSILLLLLTIITTTIMLLLHRGGCQRRRVLETALIDSTQIGHETIVII